MVDPITFRTVVRSYAEGVEANQYDPDIFPARERKFVVLILRTASNDFGATSAYAALTAEAREDIIRRLIDSQWVANVLNFVEIASPSARVLYGQALERAIDILRGI